MDRSIPSPVSSPRVVFLGKVADLFECMVKWSNYHFFSDASKAYALQVDPDLRLRILPQEKSTTLQEMLVFP